MTTLTPLAVIDPHRSGPVPSAEAAMLRAVLPSVLLPVQKAYAIGRRMLAEEVDMAVVRFRLGIRPAGSEYAYARFRVQMRGKETTVIVTPAGPADHTPPHSVPGMVAW